MQLVMKDTNMEQDRWCIACKLSDLVAGSGVCALVGGRQVAIFYLPQEAPTLYALDNFDPIGGANVLSRGIVGDVRGELVVASPLYKEHFSLTTGRCLEKDYAVRVWPIRLIGTGASATVEVQLPAAPLESVA
jgi:nitrite reductase (NADH) small subunit